MNKLYFLAIFLIGCDNNAISKEDPFWADHAALQWATGLNIRVDGVTCAHFHDTWHHDRCNVRSGNKIFNLTCDPLSHVCYPKMLIPIIK